MDGNAASEAAGKNMIVESYEQEREGITALACGVVEQAAKDYWKLKKGQGQNVKVNGAAIPREFTMLEIERFLSEDGGAKYYLELANSKISPYSILNQLKTHNDPR